MTPFRGWEPDAAPNDTITRAATLSLAERVEIFGQASGRRWHRDTKVAVRSTGGAGMAGGHGVAVAPLDQQAAGVIADVLDADESAWFMNPWPDETLAGLGFFAAGHPPFMAMWPGTAVAPQPGADVTVEEASTVEGLELAERLLLEGYPVPEAIGAPPGLGFPAGILGTDSHVFIARVGDDPVAVAASTVAAGVQHVEFVATMEQARGKGAGAAVTWAAATVEPALPCVLVASDLGRPVYERLGFQSLTRWTFWLRP